MIVKTSIVSSISLYHHSCVVESISVERCSIMISEASIGVHHGMQDE